MDRGAWGATVAELVTTKTTQHTGRAADGTMAFPAVPEFPGQSLQGFSLCS